jgi:hypothetical protein
MRLLKLVGILLGLPLVLAIAATSALATVNLPDISVTLSGGTYPIHLQGSLPTTVAALITAADVPITSEGFTLLLLTTELSALGTFNMDFGKVVSENAVPCNTAGDLEGVVLAKGEFHLVPINLAPLTLGILFLVSQFEIECPGSVGYVVRGNVAGSLNNIGTEATELTGLGTTVAAINRRQQISEYYNDGGTKIKTKLEIEAGAGFEATSLTVNAEIGLSVLGSQMIVITNR